MSLTKLPLSMMADGTDGNLITYNASGVASAVSTGSSGQVLKSAGAGSAPSFGASGGYTFVQELTADRSGDLKIDGFASFGGFGNVQSMSSTTSVPANTNMLLYGPITIGTSPTHNIAVDSQVLVKDLLNA